MKNKESKNSEEKKPIQVRLNPKDGYSSKNKDQNQDQEKTQEIEAGEYAEAYKNRYGLDPNDGKKGEEAEIIYEMDEIIKNNDKFETIRVIMEILCKELGISKESQFPTIAGAVQGVVERYYKSMEDWKNLRKQGQKQDIRQ